jgi:hypothetical protein
MASGDFGVGGGGSDVERHRIEEGTVGGGSDTACSHLSGGPGR